MIDYDDSDSAFMMGLFSEGWVSLVLIFIGIVFAVIAMRNEKDCSKMKCPISTQAQLIDHACLCVQEPTP